MPPKGLLDCSGWGHWILNEDGEFVLIRDIQTVTLSPDLTDEEDETNCGLVWDAGDPYHYTLVSEQKFTATLANRYGERWVMRWFLPPREFRRWVRRREKERRMKLKEAHNGS